VLAINAGVGVGGDFVRDTSVDDNLEIVDLNVRSAVHLAHRLISDMVDRKEGKVLFTSSIAATAPGPFHSVYAASKAFLASFAQGLREELRDTGVTVTALCPGITATGMLTKAARSNAKLGALPAFLVGDVDEVAAAGYRACMNGVVIEVPGEVNWATVVAARNAPKWLVRRVAGAVGRSVA
jgi:short-subunit dehydrogenase